MSPTVYADDVVSGVPFVSGFDRFGRHADIDPVTAGQLLITELSCTACHVSNNPMFNPKRGPVLDGVGSRVKSDWIRSFLISPTTAKPGTTMPDMLAAVPADERASTADAIAAFLSTLEQPFPEVKATALNPVPMEFWNHGDIEHGRRLYHQIGCVACHDPDAEYEITVIKSSQFDDLLEQLNADELREMGLSSAARKVNSVPHAVLPAKYTHQSLTYFLLNPEHTRPDGRMPNFSLSAVGAADIAAWLLRDTAKSASVSGTAEPNELLIERGRQFFSDLRCANCHSIPGKDAASHAKPLVELNPVSNQACWNVRRVRSSAFQPGWHLDSVQATSIQAALASLRDVADFQANELLLRLLQQNCYACHERNQLGGVGRYRKPYFETAGHVDIGDEGRLPPALTHVGNRLETSWLSLVLGGKGNVRPFMTIRMPVFPADITKPLPAMFASMDSGKTTSRDETTVFAQANDKLLLEAGRQLMDTGCVQCHAFRGESLPGVVGVDLEGITQRVRSEWLHDFLKDPGSLKDRTRMPTFFPNGQSQNHDVLNGDVELQIAAMHAYLKDLSNQPLPQKIQETRDQSYELTPMDRPVLLRTFMPVTGTHAIAVGLPQQIHFAFDAENISLSQAWRGRFLDAEGTWFIRFAPPADPLGENVITMPRGIAIATLEDKTSPWPVDAASAGARFQGYRLDYSGLPVFLYSVQGFAVTDRIESDKVNGLRRTITTVGSTIPDHPQHFWLRALSGKTLTRKSAHSMMNEAGLAVTVPQPDTQGEIRTVGGDTEWIVPLMMDVTTSGTVIRLEYSW